jgi:hypothetical protein
MPPLWITVAKLRPGAEDKLVCFRNLKIPAKTSNHWRTFPGVTFFSEWHERNCSLWGYTIRRVSTRYEVIRLRAINCHMCWQPKFADIDGSENVVTSESSNSSIWYHRFRSVALDYWNNHSFSKVSISSEYWYIMLRATVIDCLDQDFATQQLPRAEQIVFTEEFKYLIVTSSLLDDNISARSKSIARSIETSKADANNNHYTWSVASYAVGIILLLGANRTTKHWGVFSGVIPISLTSSLSLSATFLLYRDIVSQMIIWTCEKHEIELTLATFISNDNLWDDAMRLH